MALFLSEMIPRKLAVLYITLEHFFYFCYTLTQVLCASRVLVRKLAFWVTSQLRFFFFAKRPVSPVAECATMICSHLRLKRHATDERRQHGLATRA